MGGDRGPDEIVAGALEAASERDRADPLRPCRASTRGGLALVEAPTRSRCTRSRPRPSAAKPDCSLVAAVQRRRRRACGRRRLRREHRRRCSPPACSTSGASRASTVRRSPCRSRPRRPVRPARRRRERRRRPEHLLQFAQMGSIFAEEILESPNPTVRLLSIGEEPEKGNQLTLEAHALLARADAQLRRERREPRPPERRRRRRRLRRLHRQRLPEAARGHDQELLDGAPRRRSLHDPRQARRPADPAGRPPPARRGSTPTPTAAPTCSACSGLAVIAHGNSSRTRDRERDPAGRPRRRARRRRAAGRAPWQPTVCIIGALPRPLQPDPSEVTWQRPAKKSTSV